uniref:Uncharacterized protein n=1 Tax=Anopheles coluzzii TaxID=1518534 RepID=A0A8W7P4C6_ANOCL
MIKFSAALVLALVGVCLAYEHHGFVSEVKHIPYKYYGGEIGGGFGGEEGGIGGGYGGYGHGYSYSKLKKFN